VEKACMNLMVDAFFNKLARGKVGIDMGDVS
jgi:hypothetical protein